MNQNTRRLGSLVLAGTIVAGAHVAEASADTIFVPTVVEETQEEELTYPVQEGDTLGGISIKFFGTPAYYQDLADYNDVSGDYVIYVGQLIRIPKSLNRFLIPSHPREFLPDELYVVQEGDTLFGIVKKKFDSDSILDVNRLSTYNKKSDPNTIFVGEVLYIPEKDKLDLVEPRDYTLQYMMLEWRIEHPGERYPDSYIAALREQREKDQEEGFCYYHGPREKIYVMR